MFRDMPRVRALRHGEGEGRVIAAAADADAMPGATRPHEQQGRQRWCGHHAIDDGIVACRAKRLDQRRIRTESPTIEHHHAVHMSLGMQHRRVAR
jgi:hypothetical protein